MPPETSPAIDPAVLARLPEFYHPAVSPDGSRVAFYYDEHGRNDLYLLKTDTGAYERVTDGEVPRSARWHVRWSRPGESVYFHRDDAGDEQNDILAWTRDGVETVVAVDGQAIFRDTSGDGETVLYASDVGDQLNLYRYDADAGDRTQLTAYDQPTGTARFGPDDERIAYVANESETLENRDIYVMDADGGDSRRLAIGEAGSEASVTAWMPDGDRLLVSDNADDLRQAGIYDLATDEIEWLGDHEAEEAAAAISPEGRFVLVSRKRRGATMPVCYDLETGHSRELDVADGVARFPSGRAAFVDETTAVFAHSRPDARKELYAYDLEADEYDVLLEADYEDVPAAEASRGSPTGRSDTDRVSPDSFVDAEYVPYESADGLEIGGLLYDPREGPAVAAEATDVPAVVVVHGGPHARSSKAFNLTAQVLATRGYAAFMPNYRGSTGRGRTFKQAIHGDWGGKEQEDIAAAGRWLEAREWIDADRVAVYGGSYGGYSVYSQLTQYPTLWTTGIASVGITDLHALYEESMPHFKHSLRQHLGDPEENETLWRERSPIEHVERMERPIYIVHGVNDPRCPISQARFFRDALREQGWVEGEDFEYTELGEEGHGSTDMEQKVEKFALLEDYLDRRL